MRLSVQESSQCFLLCLMYHKPDPFTACLLPAPSTQRIPWFPRSIIVTRGAELRTTPHYNKQATSIVSLSRPYGVLVVCVPARSAVRSQSECSKVRPLKCQSRSFVGTPHAALFSTHFSTHISPCVKDCVLRFGSAISRFIDL